MKKRNKIFTENNTSIKKKKSGITLVTLAITIVVLLIIAGVSILSISENEGVVDQTLIARENSRGTAVAEEIDLYKVNFETERTKATKEQKIDELVAKNLLTQEEANQLKQGKSIKIGTFTISFEMSDTSLPIAPEVSLGYIVEFCNYDGTILKTVNVEEGGSVEYNEETPTRPATEEFTYTFNNWVTEREGDIAASLNNINSDKKVYASYNRRAIYKVNFCNYDGTVISVVKVNEGESAVFNETPIRPSTEDYTYEFAGWMTTQYGSTEANLNNIQKSQEVFASYKAETIVTITSAKSSIDYFDGTTDTTPMTISIDLRKPVPDELLTYTIKFYSIAGPSYTYKSGSDIVVTTTDASYSITKTATEVRNLMGMTGGVYVEITDQNGKLKASQTLGNFSLTPDENAVYFIYGYTYHTICLPAGTMVSVVVEEEDENGKKRKRRKQKRIEDLTYDDDLVVWDFDNGCFATAKPLWLMRRHEAEEYNLLKFSDGSELRTIRQHRIFNKELGKFTYPMTDETPIGTTTFKEDGTEVTLISKEVVKNDVDYYNVISNYHMNVFAEGILTSCRLSNLYEIKDMKYVKDDRELVRREEYKELPDEYFYGLRLAEQPREINRENDDKNQRTLVEYVRNLIDSKK